MTTNRTNMSGSLFGGNIHLNNHNVLHHTEEKLNNGDTCGDKCAKLINGGETQSVTRNFSFFYDHFFIVDNFCMHQLNSNSIL